MGSTISTAERATELADAGDVAAATELLRNAARSGDEAAQFELAVWLDSGRHMPRDPIEARHWFGEAARAGHAPADRVFTNFLANGRGGDRDWQAARERLRNAASSDPRAKIETELIDQMDLDEAGDPRSVPDRQQLSETPWVQLVPKLLSQNECLYLAMAAEPYLQPATVIDNASGKPVRNPIRTSHTAVFTPPLENLVVHALNRRLAVVTGTRVEQGEPLQVLRYAVGQEYKMHIDAVPSFDNQRVLTALVYLNDAYDGGETRFVGGGTVRGSHGTALIFRNVDADGRPDKQAAHCGMPVTKGFKLLASRWIRQKPFAAD